MLHVTTKEWEIKKLQQRLKDTMEEKERMMKSYDEDIQKIKDEIKKWES